MFVRCITFALARGRSRQNLFTLPPARFTALVAMTALELTAPSLTMTGCTRAKTDGTTPHGTVAPPGPQALGSSGTRAGRAWGQRTKVPALFSLDAARLRDLLRTEAKPLTVVNVWATWCGSCRHELPMLATVSKAYADRGVTVLPISVDDEQAHEAIPKTLAEFGFAPPYYVVAGDIEVFKSAMHAEWDGNLPVSFVFDARARRRHYFNAEVFENELTPVVDGLLQGKDMGGQSNFKASPESPL